MHDFYLEAATIDAFVEKVAELAGMNCNLLCPVKSDDTPVLKPTITIHGGSPINNDSDKGGREDVLPIDPKKLVIIDTVCMTLAVMIFWFLRYIFNN